MELNSPFEQYFDSDYAPTTDEICDINRLIDERQAMMDDIDARIEEMDRIRRELEDQKKGHADFIKRHRNLTTVVRGVPTDILSIIFLTLLAVSGPSSSPNPSVTISHVCHQWRRLALATPLLWTHINISTPTTVLFGEESCELWESHVRSSCSRAKTFIHRAAGLPLSVVMVVQYPLDDTVATDLMLAHHDEEDPHDILWEIAAAICHADGSAREWESTRVSVRVSQSTPLALAYLAFLDEYFRKSERITVDIDYVKTGTMRPEAWAQTEGKINLSEVSCTSLSANMGYMDLARLDANWTNLTDLSLGPGTSFGSMFRAEHVLSVLTKTPNLIRLTLQFAYLMEPLLSLPPSSQPRAHLRQLRSLNISGDFVPAWIAKALDIPSLTRLSVASSVTIRMQTEEDSALVAFVQECGHQLVHTSFDYTALAPAAFFYTLTLLTNVEVLNLLAHRREAGSSTALQSLLRSVDSAPTPRRTEGALVPKLRVLVCEIHEVTQEVREDVLGFVQARRRGKEMKGPVRWLDEIDVRFRRGSVDGMLEELRDRGVDTKLTRFTSLSE